MPAMRVTWDLFCNVVDNYGDIGVAWRLARGLAAAPERAVRLWVDDLTTFQRLWPAVDTGRDAQVCEGVTVCVWRSPFAAAEPAQVVVEAFGCALPDTYLEAMARQSPPPVWINLEYLSAEDWVAAHHGLPSPHPRLPLTKHFFFPGYTAATGGLLIERELPTRRDAFQAAATETYWRAWGLDAPAPDELRVSLFAYENAALPALLDAWAVDARPLTCMVPEGRVIPQLAAWLGRRTLAPGETAERGALRVHVLPFTDQDAYDRLQWACDLNFVRGEDSCVRAQAAARPLVWQAYPQAERAHWDKLEALLGAYVGGLDAAAADAVRGLWRGWNGVAGAPAVAGAWAAWRAQEAALARHARAWAAQLQTLGNLAETLAEFAESKLK
ncbi:MAG: elongation factor P maturation arginine rhamnosyltransferase EarP [Gammaproteobacteria bacterium]